jgi:hypothetical protein
MMTYEELIQKTREQYKNIDPIQRYLEKQRDEDYQRRRRELHQEEQWNRNM